MAIEYLRQYVKTAPIEVAEAPATSATGPIRLEDILDGVTIPHDSGTCFVAESTRHRDTAHGIHSFAHLSGMQASHLSLICNDPELAYVDMRKAVFLDTETTGLNMGTGTYVFLVGAGYMDGEHFRVKQFFLQSPGEEEAFLSALDTFLRGFSTVVTFNGKAFDWPLLENRYIRQRAFRRAPLDDPPHIDLLHPSRRLWKRRLESCRLSSLEREILGVRRTGQDVPGWLIPSLYFQYLRSGDGSVLEGVFYHNLQDILSLAALAIHIDCTVSDPMGGLVAHASDFVSLGKTFERAGQSASAVDCYEEALRREPSADDRVECSIRLGGVHKRARRWDMAVSAWDRCIDSGGEAAMHGLIERAKYHEHIEREYLEALDTVQQALRLLELSPALAAAVDQRELEHRQSRLVNRIYRNRSWVGDRG